MDTKVNPDPAKAADLLAEVESRCRRFETSCGDGSVVWRCWGSGPPVLLAHGAHGAWSHWIRNIDALAAERTVWALDLPGYGDSAMLPRLDHETNSHIIVNGLQQLMAPELPLDMVGFSYGGVALAYLAAFYPDVVRRLVLVDTGGLDTPIGSISLKGVRGLNESERIDVNRHNLLQMMLHHPDSVDDLALLIHAVNGAKARLNPVDFVIPDKLLPVLPRLNTQVDAIWGGLDQPHPNPAAQEEVLRRFFPDLDFRVVDGAGHWAMYEQPEQFNTALLELLRRGD